MAIESLSPPSQPIPQEMGALLDSHPEFNGVLERHPALHQFLNEYYRTRGLRGCLTAYQTCVSGPLNGLVDTHPNGRAILKDSLPVLGVFLQTEVDHYGSTNPEDAENLKLRIKRLDGALDMYDSRHSLPRKQSKTIPIADGGSLFSAQINSSRGIRSRR